MTDHKEEKCCEKCLGTKTDSPTGGDIYAGKIHFGVCINEGCPCHKEVPKEGWVKAFRWVKDCDMQAFPEHVDDELIPQIRALLLEARREGAKEVMRIAGRLIVPLVNVGQMGGNQLEDINTQILRARNEVLKDVIDAARTAGEKDDLTQP